MQNQPIGSFDTGHPLGTDMLGRDLLSRTIWGHASRDRRRRSPSCFGLLVGGFMGIVSGYFRGRLETGLMALMDVLLAFPALLLALSIVTFTDSQPSPWSPWPSASWASRRSRASCGPTPWSTPNASSCCRPHPGCQELPHHLAGDRAERGPGRLLPSAVIGVAVAIVAEGGLAFLGLSVPPPTPTWGGMINDGRSQLRTTPTCLVPDGHRDVPHGPGSLNLAGDRLRSTSTSRKVACEPQGDHQPEPAAGPLGPLLEVVDLKTHFRTERGTVRAVDGVSFSLDRGKTLGIVGESGSGKTMLSRSIMGLLPANTVRRGRILYEGVDIIDYDPDQMRDVWGSRWRWSSRTR
jgi:peptide/nickel transport system permease protein